MADFCTLIDKNAPPNHPNVKACAIPKCYEDVAHALTFGWNGCFGSVMSVQKCKNISLGRDLTIFFRKPTVIFPR